MKRRCVLLATGLFVAGVDAIRIQTTEVLDAIHAPMAYHTIDFDPGNIAGLGMSITEETGEVTSVEGQAQRAGVQTGWYIFKMAHHYPWSVYRWNKMKRAGHRFSVTFVDMPIRPQCQDQPFGWADNKGQNCHTYREKNMCTAYGTEGAGWVKCKWHQVGCTGKTFRTFEHQGFTAAEACCECGGGWDPIGETTTSTLAPTTTTTTTTTQTTTTTTMTTVEVTTTEDKTGPEWACLDLSPDVAGWKDKLGYTCTDYETQDWCKLEHLREFADSKGRSAYDACCACNGGDRYRRDALQAKQQSAASHLAPALALLLALGLSTS